MQKTPASLRVHIGLFGRRNVGKSSLLNAFVDQNVSIVSAEAGTTTDPVKKPIELQPLGPVLFVDTAGIDDEGALGSLRVQKTRRVIERTDIGIIVTEGSRFSQFEEQLLGEFQKRQTAAIVVFNKVDQSRPGAALLSELARRGIPVVETIAPYGTGVAELKQALLEVAPTELLIRQTILGDLVDALDTVILVVPIDKEAPKGRLILPQVQVIRDLLDHRAICLVTQDDQLKEALNRLSKPPVLVVTDSQAFAKVALATPSTIPLTSFSILFSRFKGDLTEQVRGALTIDHLEPEDRILIAEACSHHPMEDDIGRVKLPRLLRKHIKGKLIIDYARGHDFPVDLTPYKLVIHCGACVWNRREMISRVLTCVSAGVPITNYGLAIAFTLGILDRALEPFPAALHVLRQQQLLQAKR